MLKFQAVAEKTVKKL